MLQIRKIGIALLILSIFLINSAISEASMMTISTDKARYAPGEPVTVTLHSAGGFLKPVQCEVTVISFGVRNTVQTMDITELDAQTISFVWQPPEVDFRGYLLCVTAVAEDGTTVYEEIAVDVSSSWVKFPRYGYVWDFTRDADAQHKVIALNRYHINGLQYYDWQYRHHQPLADSLDKWQDWSGRWIYGDVVKRYIQAAKAHNMVSMAYNMIYAANKTYLRDDSGVNSGWRLVKANGEEFTCEMSAVRGNLGILQFFNILNPDWQAYIFNKEIQALDTMGFDGWHGDTIGEYGVMKTVDGQALGEDENGNPVRYVKDGYTIFLNKAKAALGQRYLTFNPVGAQGIEKVSISDADVLYSEFWPWEKNRWGENFDSYLSLQKEIFNAAALSGGKSLVIAAYVNYRSPEAAFNPATVRLLDSVVYASGGSRIALGNGDNMLSDEYFPADTKKIMGDELREKTVAMYDFITAYQNLLRDGQTPAKRTIVLENVKHSISGESDALWTFAMAGDDHETLHFINLTGTDNLWQDKEQTKRAPIVQNEVSVRYYTDLDFSTLYFATPDGETLAPQTLPYRVEETDGERCVVFTLPSVEYWSMVFMR